MTKHQKPRMSRKGRNPLNLDPILVSMSIFRPEDLYYPDMEDVPLYLSSHSPWESFPATMVISGGGFNKHIVGSVKRRFDQLIEANSDMDATLDKF